MTTNDAPAVNPFELHGMACGLLCGSTQTVEERATRLLCELIGLEGITPALEQTLRAVLRDCQAQMAREEADFEPLLPDEDAALAERTRALARWCDGFLAGFGAVAGSEGGRASDQEETLRDLAAIAGIDEQGADSEEDEWDFFEIKEYVRMAALSFFLDGRSGDAGSPSGPGPNDRLH